jgi:hypothetical protein
MGSFYSTEYNLESESQTLMTMLSNMFFGTPTDDVSEQYIFTKEMFKDLSLVPLDVLNKFTDIGHDQIKLDTTTMTKFIDELTIFVDTYIDLTKMGGKHSKLWFGYIHDEDTTIRHNLIRSRIVMILGVYPEDKTLGDWFKRVIAHITGDQCGGFQVPDFREDKSMTTMDYMHAHKLDGMRYYIKRKLGNGKSGVIFTTEYDWDNCLDDTCDGIEFYRFDKKIHKDNSGKGLFYSSDFTVRELGEEEIKAKMTEKECIKYMSKYDVYKSKFVVFSLTNTTEDPNDMFYEEVFGIGLHCKSMGTRKEIMKNLDEYRFLKSVIQSFKDDNSFVVGDFNLPEFNEGQDYFGLNAEDRIVYPIQNTYGEFEDTDTFMFQDYQRISIYECDKVAYKIRTGHAGMNSQSVKGKCFERNYNTDGVYAKGSFIDNMTTECSMYPPNKKDSKVVIPMFTGYKDGDWGSDHQAVETYFINIQNKDSKKYMIGAYNVLSKCCSGSQPFNPSLTSEDVKFVQDEICDYLAKLGNIIVEKM